MKKIMIFLSSVAIAIAGCSNNEFKKGEGDMLYKIHDDKSGKAIKPGDFMAISYIEKTEEGTILHNSKEYDNRLAFLFRESSSFEGDFFSAFGMLSEGDSASFKINLDSICLKTERKRPDTKGKYLLYTIKVNKVIPREDLADSLYNNAIEKFKLSEAERAKYEETSKLNRYISSQSLNPDVTPSGLNYVINRQGKGPIAVTGDTVEVNYTARYLSGKAFETNSAEVAKKADIFNPLIPYRPIKIVIEKSNPKAGFYEALTLFPKGTKTTLIIPSKLAYGGSSYQSLHPYTPLLCEMEILDIRQPSNKKTAL